jgi:hypothetical protein
MTILFGIVGLIIGLLVYAISCCILEEKGYYVGKGNLAALIFAIGVLSVIVVFIISIVNKKLISISFFVGIIIGVILSIVYICYTLFSSNGKFVRISHKIASIKSNIEFLKKCDMTDKQKQAVKLLDETQKKLKEQAYDMLIMDSIKVAKNIELSNKGIDIQRELDELEALQILNK